MVESRWVVYGAIAANVAVATTKFIVAGISGSSAMLSEGIHTAVDTGNDVLLLIGQRLSQRPPSEEHPFGHGKELYFWSLIVAVLIFGLGGGMSIYEGITHIQHPEPLTDPKWNYIVLGASALFEGTSFGIALVQFLRQAEGRPFWAALHGSKDPMTYTVLAEDGAALAGLAVAGLGVYASHRFNQPVLDGAASIVIGLLLAGVAVLLVRESRGLLIGEGVQRDTVAAILKIVRGEVHVKKVGPPLTMYVGPEDVLLALDVDFNADASAAETAAVVDRIKQAVRERFPKITRIYVGAGART